MTNHVVRLYTASAAIIVFFVAWAGIAARPWVTPAPDPQLAALAQRQQRLQRDANLVQLIAARRAAANRAAQVVARAAAQAPGGVGTIGGTSLTTYPFVAYGGSDSLYGAGSAVVTANGATATITYGAQVNMATTPRTCTFLWQATEAPN